MLDDTHLSLLADVIKIIAALVTLFSGVLPLVLRKPTPPPALPAAPAAPAKARKQRRRHG